MNYFYQYEDTVKYYFRYRIYDDFEYNMHMHEYYEIVYILDGRCILRSDGAEEIMETGSIALIMDNQLHAYELLPGEKNRCRMYMARFSKDYIRKFADDIAGKQPEKASKKCSPEAADLIQRCLTDQANEQTAIYMRKSARYFICAEFLDSITFIDRRTVMNDPSGNLILYILQNFRDNITLSSAARILGYDKHYSLGWGTLDSLLRLCPSLPRREGCPKRKTGNEERETGMGTKGGARG